MLDTVWGYPLLFLTAVIAGWVDSIAGGGGMLTIPVLLGLGIPPQTALGTNKFQGSFGSFTAASYYVHEDVVSLRDARTGIASSLVGAAAGGWAVQQMDPGVLKTVIPILLLLTAVYFIFTPLLGRSEKKPRVPRLLFYLVFGITLGFYDGFFGPGVGSFWAIAFVLCLGFGLTKATGYTKVMNFTSNVVSLILFLAGDHVLLGVGIVMAAGQIIGAKVGSGLVIRRGAEFIRPIFIGIVLLTSAKLLFDRFW